MRLTNEELAAIRERAEKATPGPWIDNGNEIVAECKPNLGIAGAISDEDAEFIAHARTDIPKLIAEVERLHANRDKAVLAIEGICEMICIALSHGESMDLGGVGSELERIREVLLDDHE
jgi:hypothetical protein